MSNLFSHIVLTENDQLRMIEELFIASEKYKLDQGGHLRLWCRSMRSFFD